LDDVDIHTGAQRSCNSFNPDPADDFVDSKIPLIRLLSVKESSRYPYFV